MSDNMLKEHAYPKLDEDNLQFKFYVKREFIIHKIPSRGTKKTYKEIKEYRDKICGGEPKLSNHQILLSNFINPSTPFKGLLLFHGTGSGKTCASIAIAEKFTPMVEKYGEKIHVLVPSKLLKQNYLDTLMSWCTGDKYINNTQIRTSTLTKTEIAVAKKNALVIINQYYRIMTYDSFYRKVMGEKIREKKRDTSGNIKYEYRKTETGEFERDISTDRITSLNNTLLIIDEAHSVKDNERANAVTMIIKKSTNLKLLLLSATPMKNAATDIIYLINFLRPLDQQINGDEIFTKDNVHKIKFKPQGREKLRNMVRGYVSYLRGADPLTFAERVDVGEIAPGLSFSKVTRCFMELFQLNTYKTISDNNEDDRLDKKSGAIANFAFPGFSKGITEVSGYYGIKGINKVKRDLKTNPSALNKLIADKILMQKVKNPDTLLYLTNNGTKISGDILNKKYLKHFSIKFHKALENIDDVVYGKKGTGLIFVYFNLVQAGVDIFSEVLIQNGYLEYQDASTDYIIKDDTKCYYCGVEHGNHKDDHEFYPATFKQVIGQRKDSDSHAAEENNEIINNVFNKIDNKNGKYIKILIGSLVMNEGVTLENIKEIHILDMHYNLGRIDQVIGRGIRYCKHYNVSTEENPFPKVEINKYVISLQGEMSSEEKLYQKAEEKYMLVKETERILQEESIDCPLFRNGNVFPEELEKYKNCGSVDNPCPAICGYMSCDYKCGDKLLNSKYYDNNSNVYKKVEQSDIDYSTFDIALASEEIDNAKDEIKKMYVVEYAYQLEDIVEYVKKSMTPYKQELFDEYYVYQALDKLIPITKNDFNNFTDIIYDKNGKIGYLIFRDKYYIWQPFGENENIPMYYRKNNIFSIPGNFSIQEYISNSKISIVDKNKISKGTYDFNTGQEYYDEREEYIYVGIIDEKISGTGSGDSDNFKIRNKMPPNSNQKRKSGLPTYKGAVCYNAYDRDKIMQIMNEIGITNDGSRKRIDLCMQIKERLYDLEKYSTSKDKNKLTYLIIPFNHPTIPFPLNLEDRIKKLITKIKKEFHIPVKYVLHVKNKKGKYDDIKYIEYTIVFDKSMEKMSTQLIAHGAVLVNGCYQISVK